MKSSMQVNYWKCEWCGGMLSDLLFRGGTKPRYHPVCGDKKRYAAKKILGVNHDITN